MASSKLMASSTSRNSDLKRKLSACTSGSSSTADFLKIGRSDVCDAFDSDSTRIDEFLRNSYVASNPDRGSNQGPAKEESSCSLLNAGITVLDASGAVTPLTDSEVARLEPPRAIRKTVDDVWREIVAGKKRQSEQVPKQEMMTLEDFLVKAGAVEDEASGLGGDGARAIVEVKEETMSGGVYVDDNSTVLGMGIGLGIDAEGFGRGRGKRSMSLLEPLDKMSQQSQRSMSLLEPLDKMSQQRHRSLSLLEPLDKAAQQRQRRMIKNRESAARSRERKQAYQVELESMAVRLEEENEMLLKEKVERTKERLKQLMENVIPVEEKRRPSRSLRRVRSVQW